MSQDSVEQLLNDIEKQPLSSSLPRVIRLAQRLGNQELERWARLELGGYVSDNPAATENMRVPEYRLVRGEIIDDYGNPVVVQDDLSFLKETALRQGAAELEGVAGQNESVSQSDPTTREFLAEKFGVPAGIHRFSPYSVAGVISRIKLEMSDKLMKLQS